MLTLLREYMETEGRAILISSHLSGDLETFFYGMRNLLDTYDPEKIPEKRGIPGLHNR